MPPRQGLGMRALCVGVLSLLGAAIGGAQPSDMDAARRSVLHAIETGALEGARHRDYATYRQALARIYSDSARTPLWTQRNLLTPQAGGLLRALASAAMRGLRAPDYDVEQLIATIAAGNGPDTMPTAEEVYRLDARLSLSAMRFMDHVHRGRIDPRSLRFALGVPHTLHDLAPLVIRLSQASSIHLTIDSLEPRYERYRALVRSLARYRRLVADSASDTASKRIAQIELAMERWRWLPDVTTNRFVVVNIPSFRLLAFDQSVANGRPVERMDVIVGSAYGNRRTPIFTEMMRFVVFQPYWDVPPSIARREEVPRIRRDHGYAARNNFEIVNGGDVGATIYPVTSANLDRVVAGTLRLRQRPGAGNALGPVKFVFPNDHNVYLHGTPAQHLFAKERRDFSHGCIRTSDPRRLAQFVLKEQPGWDAARIDAAMRLGSPLVRVSLERPIPVYILYSTVVADDEGRTHFYPDIYGHDRALARALSTSPE